MKNKLIKKHFLSLLFSCSVLFLAACAPSSGRADQEKQDSYHKIDAQTAKQMMEEQDVIVVDVRTPEEYDSAHIPEAVSVPVESIGDAMPEALPETDSVYIVYCRTGVRSKQASDKLIALGYENIYDMGGIVDWTYDTVTETKE